uniref:Putative corticosteroid 11-beta-dehydrogenase n=1 Tax=Triatoma infestans TaxID=30076 RepID=A0A023EZV8_TRIIF
MDEQTALVLAVQLTALCCIAGSLLLYLLCKAKRTANNQLNGEQSEQHQQPQETENVVVEEDLCPPVKYVLVTCVQNQLGLQLVLRLARLGFRVFAGLQDGDLDCDAARIIRAKMKSLESVPGAGQGAVILFPLDVTREDSLHEGVDHIRRHLPAGQHGLWAVVHTAGVVVKGRLEVQESCLWDSMFKVNVVGTLRTARALLPLLKVTKGRLITVGLSGECRNGAGVVAYTAARHAVAGASNALGHELAHLGISVVVINTGPITAEHMYHRVRVSRPANEEKTPSELYLQYKVDTLPDYALETIEETLLCARPKSTYELRPPRNFTHYITAITDRFSRTVHQSQQHQPKAVMATV